jgi:hypothetical protein
MSLSGHKACIKLLENGQPVLNLKRDTHTHTHTHTHIKVILVVGNRVYSNCTEGLINALTQSFQNYEYIYLIKKIPRYMCVP